MEEYLKSLHPKIQKYFEILSPEGIPEFLVEYINTEQMQKQKNISTTCGTIYSKLFNN